MAKGGYGELASGYVSIYANIKTHEIRESVRDVMSTIKGNFKVSANVSGAGKSISSLGDRLSRVGTRLGVVGLGVTALGSKFAQWGLESAAKAETVSMALTQLTGSAKSARDLIDQMSKLAIISPFNFETVQQCGQHLMALGFTSQEIIPTLTAVGDAVSAVGGNDANLQAVIHDLGVMRSRGKVTLESIRNLSRNSIPALDILSKHFGMTTQDMMEAIHKGRISADEGIKAILDGMETRFGGMMTNASKTVTGAMSNIVDAVQRGFMQLRDSDGYHSLANGLQSLIDPLMDLFEALEPIFNTILSGAGEGIKRVADFLKDIVYIAHDAQTQVGKIQLKGNVAQALQEALYWLKSIVVIAPSLMFLGKYFNVAGAALQRIAPAFAPIDRAFNKLAHSASAAIVGSRRVNGAFMNLSTQARLFGARTRDAFRNAAASLKESFFNTIDKIPGAIRKTIGAIKGIPQAAKNAVSALKQLPATIKNISVTKVKQLAAAIRELPSTIKRISVETFHKIAQGAKTAATNVRAFAQNIKQITTDGLKNASAAIKAINEDIKKIASGELKLSDVFKSAGASARKLRLHLQNVTGRRLQNVGNTVKELDNRLFHCNAALVKLSQVQAIEKLQGKLGAAAAGTVKLTQGIASISVGIGALAVVAAAGLAVVAGSFVAAGGNIDAFGQHLQTLITAANTTANKFLAAFENALPKLSQSLDKMLPQIEKSVNKLVNDVIQRVNSIIPKMVPIITKIATSIANILITNAPKILGAAMKLFAGLLQALGKTLQNIAPKLPQMVRQLAQQIARNAPAIVRGAVQLFLGIVQAIAQALPAIIAAIPQIVVAIVTALIQHLPEIISGGVQLITGIIAAIAQVAPNILSAIGELLQNVVTDIINAAPQMLDAGVQILTGLFNGVQQIGSDVLSWFGSLPGEILDALGDVGGLLVDAGESIINGFLEGLQDAFEGVKDFVGGIASWIADNKGPLDYDAQLLIPAGNAIMRGLHQGIKETFNASVKPLVRSIAGQVQGAFTGVDVAQPNIPTSGINTNWNDNERERQQQNAALLRKIEEILREIKDISGKDNNVYMDTNKVSGTLTAASDIVARAKGIVYA